MTIAAVLSAYFVSQGGIAAKNEANEKLLASHGAAIERQLLVNERMLMEIHDLSKIMIRLQTQSEDRQDERARSK